MFTQKSVLARLLANENITVQQGNYETASFDVTDRVLRLPLWKQMGNDIYDMLVGHETAHALYTPKNFFEYEGSEDIPHSWLNVVEDVRIEKLILRKYPGLVGNFKRAYREMMFGDMNLFKIKDIDLSKLTFMDRLNIKAKARDLVEVPFASDEMLYVKKAMSVETYDDVVRVCKEIQEWLKEKQQQQSEGEGGNEGDEKTLKVGVLTDNPSEGGQQTNEKPDIIIDMRENPDQSGDEQGEEGNGSGAGGDDTQDGNNGDAGDAETLQSGDANSEAMTQVSYGAGQHSLIDGDTTYVYGLSKAEAFASIMSYEEVAMHRNNRIGELKTHAYGGIKFPESEYENFIRETKSVVNLMVKEFEMRKAAYRSLRARESVRGSLDVNKLHKYRYDDMLFKQVSYLADAKNHGMMMLVDYSGSMYRQLGAVMRQTIALVMFCKRVGIPYEVYSFTSPTSSAWGNIRNTKLRLRNLNVTHIDARNLGMIKLFSSDMTKAQYEEAIRMMFWQSTNIGVMSGSEELGNTPLNEALMAMNYIIPSFREKYKVQKMNFVALTDGESNSPYVIRGKEQSGLSRRKNNIVDLGGKLISIKNLNGVGSGGRLITEAFVKNIADMGVTTTNFYIAYNARAVAQEVHMSGGDYDSSNFKRDGVYVMENNFGYDRRFILSATGKEINGEIEDLDIDDTMSVSKIAKAFTKSNGSKKQSKILTKKFSELIS